MIAGVVVKETPRESHVVSNLLNPQAVPRVARGSIDEQFPSKISPMPQGLIDVLNRAEILELVSFLEAGGYQLPKHLKRKHTHK